MNQHRPNQLDIPQHTLGPSRQEADKRRSGYYWTKEWRERRAEQLMRFPYCRDPQSIHAAQRRTVEATHVDHIKPRRMGGTDDPSNLESLCTTCHNRKTATETHKQRGHKMK